MFEQRRVRSDAGVVDHRVEGSEPLDRTCHERIDLLHLRDVAAHELCLAANRLERIERFTAADFIEIGDDDVRAFAAECQRSRSPNSAAAAGDDGDLPFERRPKLRSRQALRLNEPSARVHTPFRDRRSTPRCRRS